MLSTPPIRLGLNVDHIATLRNARGAGYPDPMRGAKIAKQLCVDGITAHLREDRRHIHDDDMVRLKEEAGLPLNFEMAVTDEMIAIARGIQPHACCLVPEKREELTTEGGLDIIGNQARVQHGVERLAEKNIRVSLFLDPDKAQLDMAKRIGAPVVELHTGAYCDAVLHGDDAKAAVELQKIQQAAAHAQTLGLECHAGHGITYDTVQPIAEIPNIVELNIGHFLIGEAVFVGLEAAIRTMRTLMDEAAARRSLLKR